MEGTYVPQLTNDEVQKLIWAANYITIGSNGLSFTFGTNKITFQTDGNMVIYNQNNSPIWASNTSNV